VSDAVVELLEQEWSAIADLVDTLSDEEWELPTALPGWSVRDNVTHIIGTESMLLGEPSPAVAVDHLPHVRDPFAAAGETWIEARRQRTRSEVRSEFLEVTGRRLASLQAMTDDELAAVGWSPIGEVPYRAFMMVRVFDCWMHEQDIRRAVGRPGHLHGPVVDAALQRFEGAIGFVVGKKAGAPDGSSVVFDVRGATERTYPIVVDGRASLLAAEDAPADPTVTISLPFETFVALGGGRWDREQAVAAGGLEVGGDEDLAQAVLDHFAFTP
jgi:uncharacterized protein (TIGR03083 family)